jgi:hypothetical protein
MPSQKKALADIRLRQPVLGVPRLPQSRLSRLSWTPDA